MYDVFAAFKVVRKTSEQLIKISNTKIGDLGKVFSLGGA